MKFLRTYLLLLINYAFFGSLQQLYAPAEDPLVNAKHTVDVAQQELTEAEKTVAQKELEAQRAETAEQEVLEKEQGLKAEESKGQDVARELQQVEAEKAQKEAEAKKAEEDLQQAKQLEIEQEQILKDAQEKLTKAEQQVTQATQSQAEKIKIAEMISNAQTMVDGLIVAEGNKQENRSLEVSVADYQDLIGKRKALEVMLKQYSVNSPEYKALQPIFVQLQGLEQVTHSKVVEAVIDIITKTPDLKVVEQKLNTIKEQLDLVRDDLDPSLMQFTKTIVDLQAKIAEIMTDKIPKEQAASQLKVIVNKQLLVTARELTNQYNNLENVEKLGTLLGQAKVMIDQRVTNVQRETLTNATMERSSNDDQISKADMLISNNQATQAREIIDQTSQKLRDRLAELNVLKGSLDLFSDNQRQTIVTEIVNLRLQLATLEAVSAKDKNIFRRITESFFRKVKTILIALGFNVVGYSNPVDGIRSSAQLVAQIDPNSSVIGNQVIVNIAGLESGQLQPNEQINLLTQVGKNINQDLITTQSTAMSKSHQSAKNSVDSFEKALDALLKANPRGITSETYRTLNLLVDQAQQSLAPAVDAVVAAQRLHVDITVMTEQADHVSYNTKIIATLQKDFQEIVKPGQSLQGNDIKDALQIDKATGRALNIPVIDPFELGHSMMSKDNAYRRQLGEQALRSFKLATLDDIFASSDYLTQRSTGSRVLSLIEIVVQAQKSGQSPQFSPEEQALYQKIKDADFFKGLSQELANLGSDTLKAWNEQSFTQWTSEQFAQLGSVREGQYAEKFGRVDKDGNKVPIVQAVRNISVYGANVPIIIDFMTGTENGFNAVSQDTMEGFKKVCVTDPISHSFALSDSIASAKGTIQDLSDRVDAMRQRLQGVKVVTDDPLNELLP